MTRYFHPEHGYHVASYGDDIEAMKAAGWAPEEQAESPSAEPESTPSDPPKRRGRKPKTVAE